MLRRLDREIRQLCRDNLGADSSAIGQATKEAVCTIVKQALRSKEVARRNGQPEARAMYLDCRGHYNYPVKVRAPERKFQAHPLA
jgi:hypothetical protein